MAVVRKCCIRVQEDVKMIFILIILTIDRYIPSLYTGSMVI